MTDRDGGRNAAATDVSADYVDCRDKEVMQALVTVGALVALADGHLEDVERDELVVFVYDALLLSHPFSHPKCGSRNPPAGSSLSICYKLAA
jgi:hypothetical protein